MRILDRRDRKALRASAIDLHHIASSIRDGKGIVPADDPPGYLAAFVVELRSLARFADGAAASMTVGQAKRAARDIADSGATGRARTNAISAFYNLVNRHALWAGVDPYEGMKGEDVNTG